MDGPMRERDPLGKSTFEGSNDILAHTGKKESEQVMSTWLSQEGQSALNVSSRYKEILARSRCGPLVAPYVPTNAQSPAPHSGIRSGVHLPRKTCSISRSLCGQDKYRLEYWLVLE
jgi:hypothetical protein